MTDIRQEPPGGGGAPNNVFSRLLTFDKLIGSALVKVVYYIGLVAIGLWVLVALVGSLGAAAYSPGAGIGGLLLTIVGGLFAIVFWRFSCELWLIIFQIHDRIGEVRDRLPPR